MKDAYDFAVHVFNTLPPSVAAFLLAWLVSFSATQPLKFLLPLSWSPATRQTIAQGVAFGAAFGAMLVQMPNAMGLLLGVICGIWSPVAYSLLILLIERRLPWLADALSADVRGVLLGQRRNSTHQGPRVPSKETP